MQYGYTELYYGTPTQVKYYDITDDKYHIGIALYDILICDDGEHMKIGDILDAAALKGIHFDKAVVELSWNKLT